MISKNIQELGTLLDDSFVLVHMTGLRQTKDEYLSAIANGTLNYDSCEDLSLTVQLQGASATLTGRSRVTAAVFGGGKHSWPLQLVLSLVNRGECWRIVLIRASLY